MTKNDIIKDCESIIKEIKLENKDLKIEFIDVKSNNFTKNKLLLIKDKDRIIATKKYIGGPKEFKLKYQENKFL